MSKKPIQESMSQIAYRQESEAKAASQALKLSKQNTERENRLLERDVHSSSSTTVQITKISVHTMEDQLTQVKLELEQAQNTIAKYKDLESRYYANIEINNKAKESWQIRLLEVQKKAADAQNLGILSQLSVEQARLDVLKYANDNPSSSASSMVTKAPAATNAIQQINLPAGQPFTQVQAVITDTQTLSTQSMINLEKTRLDALKYANDNPSSTVSSMTTHAPAATNVIQQVNLPAGQTFFSSKASETLTIQQRIVTTKVNLKITGVTLDFQAFIGEVYLRDSLLSKIDSNSKNVHFNVLETENNNLNSLNLVKSVGQVPVSLKQTLNVINLRELDKYVLDNLSLCHSKYLSPFDKGVILIDSGSIFSKNIEVIFDCGCFKSVIPESFVKSSGLDCISYRNCGFVANDVKIEIFGATVNTPFKYKNTLTNMSFIILPRHNILLGMDWLSLNNATINFGTRTICFKEEPDTFHNIINDSLKNDSNQFCLSTLDQTNDKIYKPMEEPPDKVDNELTDPNEIKRFKEFFSIVTKDLEKSNCILEYFIDTNDQKPVSFEPYGRSVFEKELLNKDVEEMIKANIIEPGQYDLFIRKINPDQENQIAISLSDKQMNNRLAINFKPLNGMPKNKS